MLVKQRGLMTPKFKKLSKRKKIFLYTFLSFATLVPVVSITAVACSPTGNEPPGPITKEQELANINQKIINQLALHLNNKVVNGNLAKYSAHLATKEQVKSFILERLQDLKIITIENRNYEVDLKQLYVLKITPISEISLKVKLGYGKSQAKTAEINLNGFLKDNIIPSSDNKKQNNSTDEKKNTVSDSKNINVEKTTENKSQDNKVVSNLNNNKSSDNSKYNTELNNSNKTDPNLFILNTLSNQIRTIFLNKIIKFSFVENNRRVINKNDLNQQILSMIPPEFTIDGIQYNVNSDFLIKLQEISKISMNKIKVNFKISYKDLYDVFEIYLNVYEYTNLDNEPKTYSQFEENENNNQSNTVDLSASPSIEINKIFNTHISASDKSTETVFSPDLSLSSDNSIKKNTNLEENNNNAFRDEHTFNEWTLNVIDKTQIQNNTANVLVSESQNIINNNHTIDDVDNSSTVLNVFENNILVKDNFENIQKVDVKSNNDNNEDKYKGNKNFSFNDKKRLSILITNYFQTKVKIPYEYRQTDISELHYDDIKSILDLYLPYDFLFDGININLKWDNLKIDEIYSKQWSGKVIAVLKYKNTIEFQISINGFSRNNNFIKIH